MAADLAIKEPCRVATTGNLASLSGLSPIDGVTPSAGNRVLVRAQTTATQNGIYTAASGSWTRATDFDGAGEVTGGTQVYVQQGTTLGDITWRVAGDTAVTPGTNAITFDPEFLQAGSGAVPRNVQDKLRDYVSLPDFRTPGASDDTAAFRLALATGKPIYLPGGKGADSGTYRIETPYSASQVGYLPADTVIFGDGMGNTVVRPLTHDQDIFRQLSSGSGAQDDNIVLRDMTLHGWASTASDFEESIHLAQFNGTRRLLVERVEFKDFRGDGLLIGSGEFPDTEFHNLDFTVRDCVFSAANETLRDFTRNGITIIDGDGGLIENCQFQTLSRRSIPDRMPGAIDMEPNTAPASVIRNITIRKCSFSNIGGGVGAISIVMPSTAEVARNIQILDNDFRNCEAADIAISMGREVAADGLDSGIVIDGNYGSQGWKPVNLTSVKGVTVTDTNLWHDYDTTTLLGWLDAGTGVRNIVYRAQHVLVGTEPDQASILVGIVDGLVISGRHDRSGYDSVNGWVIAFLPLAMGETSSNVTIENFKVIPNPSQPDAIAALGAHAFTPATNRFGPNVDLGGRTRTFPATAPGQLLTASTTFDPSSLADGTGETSGGITVTGAAFGDEVTVSAPYDLQGILCTGYVSAADTVKIRLQNETGGTINLASGTWKLIVQKALA